MTPAIQHGAAGDPPARRPDHLDLQYLEAVRLCLDGGFPLDWYQLHFRSAEQVQLFLRANRASTHDEFDRVRLRHLHREAVRYVRRHYGYRFPAVVAEPQNIEDVFLLASGGPPIRRTQVLACVVLKLMHVINHLEAHSLLHETAVSEAELEMEVEHRLMRAGKQMMADGIPIHTFYGNRKSRDSMITKLLVKHHSTATEILDRVRFRIVTATQDDLVPTLAWLMRHVLPFNHVLGQESLNNLVDLDRWLAEHSLSSMSRALHPPAGEPVQVPTNEFSGDSYRIANFVVEVPLRLDLLSSHLERDFSPETGRTVYVQAELQVLDRETAYNNERGENSHALYKKRQWEAANRRLKWGSLRHRKKKDDPTSIR